MRMTGETQERPTTGDTHAADVIARIAEFVDPAVPWHRALWLTSSILSLRELLEHGEMLQHNSVSRDQPKDAIEVAWENVHRDAGIADPAVKSALEALLNPDRPEDLTKEPMCFRLAHLAARASEGYLDGWRAALAVAPEERPRPEPAARYLTAHLLDSGISPERIGTLLVETQPADQQLQAFCEASNIGAVG
jgi:hypothetical protein